MIITVVLKPEQYNQQPDELKFSKEFEEIIQLFRPFKDWYVADGKLYLELANG